MALIHLGTDKPITKLSDYLTIKDAAEYIGVSQNTLRNWGKNGRIKERRHPVNDYRLYAVDELNALLNRVERPKKTADNRVRKSK